MSELKTTSLSHKDNNTGTPNVTLYPDGTTSLSDFTTVSQNGGQIAGLRNKFINGAMQIWQRGTIGTSAYVADRWRTSGGPQKSRRLANDLQKHGIVYALQNDANQAVQFKQFVELDRVQNSAPFATGTTWTWSVYSNFPPTSQQIRWTGNDGAVSDNDVLPSGTGTWEVIETAGSYKRYALTFTVPGGPSNGSTTCLEFRVNMGFNQQYTGCQVEAGPVATPFEHRPIGMELSLCQRYYVGIDGSVIGFSYQTDAQNGRIAECSFPVTMRTNPTITTGSQVNWSTINTTSVSVDRVKFEGSSANTAQTTYVTDVKADAEL